MMDSMLQTPLSLNRLERYRQKLSARASYSLQMALLYLFLILFAIAVLYPLVWMLGAAFKPDPEILSARLNPIPLNPTLDSMKQMFDTIPVARNVFNSFFVAITSTALGLFFTSLGGYAFAKFNFPGNKLLFYFILATLLIPPELNLVPSFLIMVRLGWVNTYWPLIIPGAASAFGIFLMRQYITGIPTELLEAARLDGASEFGVFWRIVLPIMKPALAALGTLSFVGSWNDFVWPLIILREPNMHTIMVSVSKLPTVQGFNTPWGVIMAGATVAVLPTLLVFLFAQRFIISGITLGSVRG